MNDALRLVVGTSLYVALADRELCDSERKVLGQHIRGMDPELNNGDAMRLVVATLVESSTDEPLESLSLLARTVSAENLRASLRCAIEVAACEDGLGASERARLAEIGTLYGFSEVDVARTIERFAAETDRDSRTLRRLSYRD